MLKDFEAKKDVDFDTTEEPGHSLEVLTCQVFQSAVVSLTRIAGTILLLCT